MVEPEDTLDEVMLEIEDERLNRKTDLIQNVKKWMTQKDVAEEFKKIMNRRMPNLEDKSKIPTERVINESIFNKDNFKHGFTGFMMGAIDGFLEWINNKYENYEKEQQVIIKSFNDIFETLKDLIEENKGDQDYNNFVNDVLFIFYNCVIDMTKKLTNTLYISRLDAANQEAAILFEIFSEKILKRKTQPSTSRTASSSTSISSATSGYSTSSEDSLLSMHSIDSEGKLSQKFKPNGKSFVFKKIKTIKVKYKKEGEKEQEQQRSFTTIIVDKEDEDEEGSSSSSFKVSKESFTKLVRMDSVLNHVQSKHPALASEVKVMHSIYNLKQIFDEDSISESSSSFSSSPSSSSPSTASSSPSSNLQKFKHQICEKYAEVSLLTDSFDAMTDKESSSMTSDGLQKEAEVVEAEVEAVNNEISKTVKEKFTPFIENLLVPKLDLSFSKKTNTPRPLTASSNISELTWDGEFDDFLEDLNEINYPDDAYNKSKFSEFIEPVNVGEITDESSNGSIPVVPKKKLDDGVKANLTEIATIVKTIEETTIEKAVKFYSEYSQDLYKKLVNDTYTISDKELIEIESKTKSRHYFLGIMYKTNGQWNSKLLDVNDSIYNTINNNPFSVKIKDKQVECSHFSEIYRYYYSSCLDDNITEKTGRKIRKKKDEEAKLFHIGLTTKDNFKRRIKTKKINSTETPKNQIMESDEKTMERIAKDVNDGTNRYKSDSTTLKAPDDDLKDQMPRENSFAFIIKNNPDIHSMLYLVVYNKKGPSENKPCFIVIPFNHQQCFNLI